MNFNQLRQQIELGFKAFNKLPFEYRNSVVKSGIFALLYDAEHAMHSHNIKAMNDCLTDAINKFNDLIEGKYAGFNDPKDEPIPKIPRHMVDYMLKAIAVELFWDRVLANTIETSEVYE